MAENDKSLVINADINEIPRVSVALETLMREHAFPEEDILDTQLAVEEAVTNVIMHGYGDAGGEITVLFRASRGIVEIQIEDRARPFNPLTLPEPDLTGDVDDRRIGGLGIFLIRRVMDEILYRYEDGKNVLVLIKKKTS
jgi:anti-sigma regulatory factor (Ser/Thr protein kinase)